MRRFAAGFVTVIVMTVLNTIAWYKFHDEIQYLLKSIHSVLNITSISVSLVYCTPPVVCGLVMYELLTNISHLG